MTQPARRTRRYLAISTPSSPAEFGIGKTAISQLDAQQEKHNRIRLDSLQSRRETIQGRPAQTIVDYVPMRVQARFPPPDLSGVLDLALLDDTRTPEIQAGIWKGSSDLDFRELRLETSSNIKAYTTPRIPGARFRCAIETPIYAYSGLVLLPGFLSHEKQKELVRWSLTDHARHPNETNLDIHYTLPDEGLWTACERARRGPCEEIWVQPRASTSELQPAAAKEARGPRQLVNNTPATPDNFVELYNSPKLPSSPSTTVQPTLATALLPKLRWANIGWVPALSYGLC